MSETIEQAEEQIEDAEVVTPPPAPPAPEADEQDDDVETQPHALPEHLKNLPPEFFTDKLGKPFVLFVGLMHVLHEKSKGRFSIKTDLIKRPDADSPDAIVRCDLVIFDEKRQPLIEVTEWGDASVTNTNKMVGAHVIRMACTRSIARAIRHAVDIGLTAADEMGSGARGGGARPRFEPQRYNNSNGPARPPATATPQQMTQSGRGPAPRQDLIKVGERMLTRAQVIKAVQKYEMEANALSIPFKRPAKGDQSPLSELVGFGQALKKKIEDKKKEGEAPSEPPSDL